MAVNTGWLVYTAANWQNWFWEPCWRSIKALNWQCFVSGDEGRGCFMFTQQGVCLVPCHSVQGPRDPRRSFAAHVLRLRFILLKSSLSLLARASLLLGWLGPALSSLHQLQSQVQWSIQRITALDWCGESDLWIIIQPPVEYAIPEECK